MVFFQEYDIKEIAGPLSGRLAVLVRMDLLADAAVHVVAVLDDRDPRGW
jgi:hypothetical protein